MDRGRIVDEDGMKPFFPVALLMLLHPSCSSTAAPGEPSAELMASEAAVEPVVESRELSVSDVAWKERLEQPYVYVEVLGDYRELGAPMRQLLERARLAGVGVSEPPFTLYFDDPARTPVDRLRARVCLPVRDGASGAPGLQADLLPRALVAYVEVQGAYPELPRVYPALFSFVQDHGWAPSGPLREIYLVDPGLVRDWRELAREVQLPWQPAR
jgi:effector-binding domain-containing protein